MSFWKRLVESIRANRTDDVLSVINHETNNSTRTYYIEAIFDMIVEQCTETNMLMYTTFTKATRDILHKNMILPIIKYNKLFLLDQLYEPDIGENYAFCEFAAKYNNLEALQWLVDHSKPFHDKSLAMCSIRYNRLHILEWAIKHQSVALTSDCCMMAARYGHFHILKWLRSLTPPCPWNAETPCAAANFNNIDILEWAIINGCPVDRRSCTGMISTHNFTAFKWLCSIYSTYITDSQNLYEAVNHESWQIVDWLLAQGCSWSADTKIIINTALDATHCIGSSSLFTFLIYSALSRGCPFYQKSLSQQIISWVIEYFQCLEYYKASRWLEQRYPAYFLCAKQNWLTAIDQHLGQNSLPYELNALIKDYI